MVTQEAGQEDFSSLCTLLPVLFPSPMLAGEVPNLTQGALRKMSPVSVAASLIPLNTKLDILTYFNDFQPFSSHGTPKLITKIL